MKVADFVRRLNEISKMTGLGDDTQVVLRSPKSEWDTVFYDRCCPEQIEVIEVINDSFIPGEFYREAGNDDSDREVVKAIVIRPNLIQ